MSPTLYKFSSVRKEIKIVVNNVDLSFVNVNSFLHVHLTNGGDRITLARTNYYKKCFFFLQKFLVERAGNRPEPPNKENFMSDICKLTKTYLLR